MALVATLPAGAAPGSLDRGFGRAGITTASVSGDPLADEAAVALDRTADGRFVVAALTDGATAALRFLPDGSPDRSFGFGGAARVPIPGFQALAVAAAPDGRVVLAGTLDGADVAGQLDAAVAVFDPDGRPSTAFGPAGVQGLDFGDTADLVTTVGVDPAGRIVVAGSNERDAIVVRFLSNGRRDPSFGRDGVRVTDLGASEGEGWTALVLDGSDVVVAGLAVTGSAEDPVQTVLARFTAAGQPDLAFGLGGQVRSGRNDEVPFGLARSPDGRLTVGLFRAEDVAVERRFADGRPDPSFGVDGLAAAVLRPDALPGGLDVGPDGSVAISGDVLVGDVTAFALVTRLRQNGAIDAGFGCRGTTYVDPADGIEVTAPVVTEPDGAIVVAGARITPLGPESVAGDILLARLENRAPLGSGYWLASAAGDVEAFGDAGPCPTASTQALVAPIVAMARGTSSDGYLLASADGGVFAFGEARFRGSIGGRRLNRPVVGMAADPDGSGYWLVASDGGIFAFDAPFLGSLGAAPLNAPIVGMAATRTGLGYWLVASDGGIFAFGDARFSGSTGGRRINAPIVGMAATTDGAGYWLVASDGGIFAFGSAAFRGSTGGRRLARPITGMAADLDGSGYWLVASDGGIFAFDAPFLGSIGSRPPSAPVVAVASS